MGKVQKNVTWKPFGGKCKCIVENCGKVFDNSTQVGSHQHGTHFITEYRKERVSENQKKRRVKSNAISASNFRRTTGKMFKLESKFNPKSAGYRHYKKIRDASLRQVRKYPYYGSVFYLYRLPKNTPNFQFPAILDVLPKLKVHIFFSSSKGHVTCKSLKKNGGSDIVDKIKRGYKCYRLTFKFNSGTNNANMMECYYWEQFWKEFSIFKKDHPTRAGLTKVEPLNQTLVSKCGYKPILSDKDWDLAYEYASTSEPLIPIPTDFLPEMYLNPINYPHFEEYEL